MKKLSKRILNLTKLTPVERKLLNDLSLEIRVPFNELISKISSQYENSVVWHLSSVASRDSYLSQMFLWCCQLTLIKKEIESGKQLDVLVTDSRGMQKLLRRYFLEHAIDIKVRFSGPILVRIIKILKPIKNFIDTLIGIVKTYFYAKMLKRKKPYNFLKPITLLDCFILQSSFTKDNNCYIDRYYTGFLNYISESEKEYFYYLPTFVGVKDFKSVIKKARSIENNFLLKEDFLKINDYINSFYGILDTLIKAYQIKTGSIQFITFDVLPLVREEIKTTCSNGSSVTALLNYLFIKRLMKQNIPVRIVIDWNENQVIDKGLIKGVHDFLLDTKTIGYQGIIISPQFNMHIRPTTYESLVGLIPDELAVIGDGWIKGAKEFCPQISVITAPSGRFAKVWQDDLNSSICDNLYPLLPLPIDKKESKMILHLVYEAIKLIKSNLLYVLIKEHPIYSQHDISQLFGSKWPVNFKFISGDFHDCLLKASMVISSSSSTCFESIAKGIPVIILGNQSGLTNNPIPENINKNIWKLCYTSKELANSIKQFSHREPEKIREQSKLGKEIRAKYFEPVTREGVRQFFQMPN